MTSPRALASVGLASVIAGAVVIAACGGKVDGGSVSFNEPSPSPTSGRPPTGGPGGRGPGSSASAPSSAAAAASEIADTYCKTFSSCCVGAGQAPIDAARCRDLTSAVVEPKIARTGISFTAKEVAACVEAIRARTAACGKEDVRWWELSDVALFGPSSIQVGCEAVLGPQKGTGAAACTSDASCGGAPAKCAIDECSVDGRLGQACVDDPRCLDGASCSGGTCASPLNLDVGVPCKDDGECRLGLVCAASLCAPAREHPELYKERHSPYRVGADTCRVFTTL